MLKKITTRRRELVVRRKRQKKKKKKKKDDEKVCIKLPWPWRNDDEEVRGHKNLLEKIRGEIGLGSNWILYKHELADTVD